MVKDFLQTENYKEYGQRIERFFTSKPKQDEDIFSYMSRLEKYREEVEKLEHLSQDIGETVKIPRFFQVWKILSGLEQFPEYRVYTEKVQQMEPKQYLTLQVGDIRTELHKLHSNKVQLDTGSEKKQEVVGYNTVVGGRPPTNRVSGEGRGGTQGRNRGSGMERTPSVHNHPNPPNKNRSLTPRKFSITTTLQHLKVPEGECMGYFTHGNCPRQSKNRPCHFKHTPKQINHNNHNQNQVNLKCRFTHTTTQTVGNNQTTTKTERVVPRLQ